MGNCLVTKLKGVVNNSNLPKLGELQIHIRKVANYSEGKSRMRILASEDVEVRVSDGGYFALTFAGLQTDRLTSTTLANGGIRYLYFPNENFEVFLSNKYAISTCEIVVGDDAGNSVVSFNLDDLLFNQKNNMSIDLSNTCTGDLNKIASNPGIKFVELRTNRAPLTGSIEVFQNHDTLQNMNIQDADVYGSIETLGACPLTEMKLGNTKVTGTVEGFVAAQVAAGRTTGGAACWYLLNRTNVTFGGLHAYGADYMSWSEGGAKIRMYNESSIESATKIWAKGYSAQEIAAWEQAGKTVVVIE